MSEPKISMTLEQLRYLLDEQKENVIKRLKSNSYLYNSESTDGQSYSLKINEEKMREIGMKARYPDTYTTLKAYLPDGN